MSGGRTRGQGDVVPRLREYWIRLGVLMVGIVTGVAMTVLTTQGWPWPASDPRVGEDTRLVVLAGQDSTHARQDRIDAWNAWAATWNRAHPDRRKPFATVVWLPSAADDQLAEMLRRAQSLQPDAEDSKADVFVLDAPWTRQFAAHGYIRRLGISVDTSQFLPQPLRTCRFNDNLYALPFNTDAGLLFSWNPLVPGGVSVPSPGSWTELRNAANHSNPRLSAFAGQFGPRESFVVNVLEGVLARGGQILDNGGNLRLRDQKVQDAVQELSRDLQDKRAFVARSEELNEDTSKEVFMRHEAVYLRDWPAFAPRTIDHALDPNVVVKPLPWPSVLGGQNLAIAKNSRYPQAAQELIEWLAGEASQLRLFEDGGFAPTRQAIYFDPKITNDRRYSYAGSLKTAVDQARPRPSVPNYPLFSQVFERVMRQVLANGGRLSEADIEQIQAAEKGQVPGATRR
jgi:multiple sugar transport system substrate-binding protein